MVRSKKVSRRNYLTSLLITFIIQLIQGCGYAYEVKPEYEEIVSQFRIEKVNSYYEDYCEMSGYTEVYYYFSYTIHLWKDPHKKEMKNLEKLKGFNDY